MNRRNLVVVRAGEKSLHRNWLQGGSARTWDLWINYFGAIPGQYASDGEGYYPCGATKYPALHRQLVERAIEWKSYDWIWLPDDDLDANTDSINRLFELCAQYQLPVAQPALTPDSYFSHGITLHNRYFRLRYTNFVEAMGPCFERAYLERCLPIFAESLSGWGTDHIWSQMVPPGRRAAILDAVQVRHTRPIGGPIYTAAGVDPSQEMRALLQKHGFAEVRPAVTGALDSAGQIVPSDQLVWQTLLGAPLEHLQNPNFVHGFIVPQLSSFGSAPPPEPSPLAGLRMELAQQLAVPDQTGNSPVLAPEVHQTVGALLQISPDSISYNEWEDRYRQSLRALLRASSASTAKPGTKLASLLYEMPHRLAAPVRLDEFPAPFRAELLTWLLRAPQLVAASGEAEQYAEFIDGLSQQVLELNDAALDREFALRANYIPVYFCARNVRDLYRRRGQILTRFINAQGVQSDCKLPQRDGPGPIRIGILLSYYLAHTETFTTLPAFRYLDQTQFQVKLFAIGRSGHPMESKCENIAGSRITYLPQDFARAVSTIRAENLDAILIGTNTTAVTSTLALVAACRLAPLQVTGFSSPVTTGLPNIDCYFSGDLTETGERPSDNYCEELVRLKGSGFCFDYSLAELPDRGPIPRSTIQIPESAVVFASGANMFKIGADLSNVWARILARVPNSYLMLYPFGPAWSNSYPERRFQDMVKNALESVGVSGSRLRVVQGLQDRAMVSRLLANADVYLDSFPYSGANSNVDPLELSIPVVALRGSTLRLQQGPAMLLDLNLPDLAVSTVDDYIETAVSLGNDLQFRRATCDRIRSRMAMLPRFLNARDYARQFGDAVAERVMAQRLAGQRR